MSITLSLVTASVLLASCHGTPPSDASMIDLFQHHRAAFERLRDMAQEDFKNHGVSVVSEDDLSRFPADRAAIYRALFEQIGAPSGLFVDTNSVQFRVYAASFAGEGSEKQIMWATASPGKLYTTLDGNLSDPDELIFRRIDEDWYLAYGAG